MPTVLCQGGFAFRIYPADHGPPHVHVLLGGGQEVRIALGAADTAPSVLKARHMPPHKIRRALGIVEDNQEHFLDAWGVWNDP